LKSLFSRVKKVAAEKDRRAVITTVLKWVVMVTTAVVNVATVVKLVG